MSAWVTEVGFDDGDDIVKKTKVDVYKGQKKGQIDRIAVVWRRKGEDGKEIMGKVKFVYANTHYVEGLGYIACDQGYCCERLGASKGRVGTIIVQYATDMKGVVDKSSFKDYVVLPWVFNGDTYDDLKRRNKENPLHIKDLEIKCNDPKYQNLDIVPSGDCLWQKVKGMPEDILKKVRDLETALPGLLCRKVAIEDLKEKLGDEVEAVTESNDSVDFSDVLENL